MWRGGGDWEGARLGRGECWMARGPSDRHATGRLSCYVSTPLKDNLFVARQ